MWLVPMNSAAVVDSHLSVGLSLLLLRLKWSVLSFTLDISTIETAMFRAGINIFGYGSRTFHPQRLSSLGAKSPHRE